VKAKKAIVYHIGRMPNARLSKSKVNALAPYVEGLVRSGRWKPAALIEVARPVSSPFHTAFIWNKKYNEQLGLLEQSRHIISSFDVYSEEVPMKAPQRWTIYVRSVDSMVPYTKVVSTPRLRNAVMQDAWTELRTWRDRYANIGFNEFGNVFAAIAEVERRFNLNQAAKTVAA